jgi:nitrile hydratase subunit beta
VNGIHDMGGMHGLGEIGYRGDDPAFRAAWEVRVHALATALAAYGKWRALRPEIEAIPAAEYLSMSYYERWLAALTEAVAKSGLASRAEIASGSAEPGIERSAPALTAATARTATLATPREERAIHVEPRFRVGQRVRGVNLNPPTHTRMPRYTRGRVGVVERDRGVFALPDTDVYFGDPKPQHVYLIRFTAHELWGGGAAGRDAVYIDLWQDYLEPA